ncbi:hypothetical protein ACVWXO_000758 [Bradyrhizobium sp. LM2.7]
MARTLFVLSTTLLQPACHAKIAESKRSSVNAICRKRDSVVKPTSAGHSALGASDQARLATQTNGEDR